MKRIRLAYLAEVPITNGLGLPGEHDDPSWPRYVRTTDIESPTSLRTDVFASQPPEVAATARLEHGDIVATAAGATIGKSMTYLESRDACYAGFLVRFRAKSSVDRRFIAYWMQSNDYWAQIEAGAVRSTIDNFSASKYRALLAPDMSVEEQRRIADFLDDRVARIDQMITARNQQTARLEATLVRASFDAVRGAGQLARRESGLAWLGTIPNSWPLVTVATEFRVDLGKMLDEKRQTGTSAIPYLRNTNVQWDHVDVSDLKEMDIDRTERERYCVRPGDLLICEGGQPGRSAVWLGELAPLGFQKALHRARSRGRSRPGWLLECLRVAAHLNVFAVENGQTTIGHLTNEQLRSFRLPFPDPSEQDRALERLHSCQAEVRGTQAALTTGVELLLEYKQSLITAAVTGELDVTTAGSGIPNSHLTC